MNTKSPLLPTALLILGLGLTSCDGETKNLKETTMENNPFFEKYDTPFEVPPFDKIELAHYKPAFLKGIEEQAQEIDAIVNNEEAPNFENTILALEHSGELLGKVSAVFYNINSAHTNKDLQDLAKEIAPLMSAHSDNISLNEALFERIKTVYNAKDNLGLTPEQLRLLEKKYSSFERSGANLSEEDKTKLRKINEQSSLLTLKFRNNVLAETNNYSLVIENEADLAGLPAGLIETASQVATEKGHEGKWVFTLHNPSLLPFLQYADNRSLRKEIWEAYQTRANQDNEFNNNPVIEELVNLRVQRAKLLGYDNHAAYKLEKSMAGSPKEVYELLNKLWTPALEKAKVEAKDLQKMIDASGGDFKLAPYDWRYYTEKIRQERYELDEEEVKPYFSLPNVQNGIFDLCNRLFGLQFEILDNVPLYHEDAIAVEVKEANGDHVGVLYMDFHARESKSGGAWMTEYRTQTTENGKRKAPVISIVCNYSKGSENKPALLNFDEVTTFFHEFGHALHGLLSDVTYESLAGTNVYTDFVELPSQIMENWATEPEFMRIYAKHYETGEVLPEELIEKLQASDTFDQGFATTEYLAASLLDMAYHTINEELTTSVQEFEQNAMSEIGLIDEIIPRYRSTYFSHIFAGGYSAGYYSYIWSGVLDTDAYEAFKETSLFNQEIANGFRTKILERGGTKDPMELYIQFRGAKPSITPLLNKRGLK